MTDWQSVEESLRVDEALDALGFVEAMRRNSEIWCPCQLPSHAGADKNPSFSVNEDSHLWNCLTCSDGGSFPSLVVRMHSLEDVGSRGNPGFLSAWDQAVEWLVQFSDASTDEDDAFVKQMDNYLKRPERVYMKGRSLSLPFFSPRVLEPHRGLGKVFWAGRGISEAGMEQFELGFDQERHRGEYIGPAALIPHFFGGKLVGYQERWIDHGSEGFPEWIPKYTNSTDFPKADTLFNYDFAIRCDGVVVLVESPITVVRLWQLGIPAVASFGASVNDAQVRLLSAFTNGINVSFDNDADTWKNNKWVEGAGKKATRKLLKQLCDLISVEVTPPPKGKKADLGDLPDDEIVAQLALAEPGFLWIPATNR